MKDDYQAVAVWDKEAMLVSTGTIGRGAPVGSQITIPPVGLVKVLERESVGVLEEGLPTLCFFFAQLEGEGGVCPWLEAVKFGWLGERQAGNSQP